MEGAFGAPDQFFSADELVPAIASHAITVATSPYLCGGESFG